MKTVRVFPLFAVLLVAGCQTSPPVPNDGRVTVTFDQADRFTDVKYYYQGPADQGYLEDLRHYLEQSARGYLAEGQRLTIKITDIDMAGDVSPATSRHGDVRIIGAGYPPRLKFSYAVTDASGRTVSQGEENLTDPAYQPRIRSASISDPLFYEKALSADWMSSKLRQ